MLIMIGSGTKDIKKNYLKDTSGKDKSLYLNYGLLGLATNLKERTNQEVIMIQGINESSTQIINIIKTYSPIEDITTPIFISIPSFLSVDWSKELIYDLKAINPKLKIVVGGRWVVDKNSKYMQRNFSNVDYISTGTPDDSIELLLDPNNWSKEINTNYSKPFSKLDYSIIHKFKQFQPVVEVQRGCGQGCSFCLEKSALPTKLKEPSDILREIEMINTLYGDTKLNYYFESSMFNPSVKWSKEFRDLYLAHKYEFKWRMTTRVDTFDKETIVYLTEAGLRVIDFGLESASPTQLLNMSKTKSPQKYLEKASELLKESAKYGVWTKLNILLYIGENETTLNETTKWLLDRKDYIKGVSVNPLTIYLDEEESPSWVKHLQSRDCVVDTKELYSKGFTYPSLSSMLSSDKAKTITEDLTNLIMTKQDYDDLKSFSYMKRNY